MKCPICGCKMKEEFMCPFCKITGEQVRNASNQEALKRIKKKDTKEVYMSSYLPKDVNNTRLLVIALLGGFLGIHQLYVGKYKTGLFYAISSFFSILFFVLSHYIFKGVVWLEYLMNFGYMLGAVIMFCWISDVIKILFRSFSIPVVLGEIQYNKKEKKK